MDESYLRVVYMSEYYPLETAVHRGGCHVIQAVTPQDQALSHWHFPVAYSKRLFLRWRMASFNARSTMLLSSGAHRLTTPIPHSDGYGTVL